MATLEDLTEELAALLSDPLNAVWAPEDLEQYLRAAVREWSNHFPARRTLSIDCTDATHNYELPADFIAMISVEYPDGESPPEFLTQKSRLQSDWWESDLYYDVEQPNDPTETASLYISPSPAATEDIVIIYSAQLDSALVAADTVPIHDRYHSTLLMYGVWLAWLERVSAEEQNPDRSTSMLQQHAANADRAWRNWTEALNRHINRSAISSITVRWPIDNDDPVY